jgi:hypothetical protein
MLSAYFCEAVTHSVGYQYPYQGLIAETSTHIDCFEGPKQRYFWLYFYNIVVPRFEHSQILRFEPAWTITSPATRFSWSIGSCANGRFRGHGFQRIGCYSQVYFKQSRWQTWQRAYRYIDGTCRASLDCLGILTP